MRQPSPPDPPPSERTRLRRHPERGSYSEEVIHPLLDAALICRVAVVHDDTPCIIPTAFRRLGRWIYLHGSTANRVLRVIGERSPVCIEVTHLDGLVLARSAFSTSMNYRSVIVYGHGERVSDPTEKLRALRETVEHLCPGRFDDIRPPSERELLQTLVVRVPIEEASAKIRSGPPADDEADHGLSCWAGVLSLESRAGRFDRDAHLRSAIPLPDYLRAWSARTPFGSTSEPLEETTRESD